MFDNILDYFPITTLPIEALILLGAALATGTTLLILLRQRLKAIRRRVIADDEDPLPVDGYPAASVIVYSQGDSTNLRTLLVQILEQDYPSALEVIVVNDENADSTEEVVSSLQIRYRNLYMTFAPERSRNLSRKKLAVTLGMKAARHDVVLLTSGNCRIDSPVWLRLMTRHFIDGKEIVAGNSLPGTVVDTEENGQEVRAARLPSTDTFDQQWSALRSFGAACRGRRVFMGDCNNIAYSRHLFFDNKGFYRTLNLNYGDDDIFINEIATHDNSTIELSPDAGVVSLEANAKELYRVYKLRRIFTSSFLPRKPYLFMSLLSWLSWAFLLSLCAATALSLPGLTIAATSLIILLSVCLPLMSAWRKTGKALGYPRQAFLTQPFLMLWHPFYNLRYKIRARRTRNENYTWSQKL